MNIEDFFKENPKVALAFSGGVDSAYLLYAAVKYGCDVKAYYVKSAFQPQFELDDALSLAKSLGAQMQIIKVDVLADPNVVANPANRCYYCKKGIFGAILKVAREDGYTTILDGTNASDDANDRPGMKALEEYQVLSPLRLCGITKAEVRELSREAGLFTWQKPAYACLATRIKCGEEITEEKLKITEMAENHLSMLGFMDFRVRMEGNNARVQVKKEQLRHLEVMRGEILSGLRPYYDKIIFDSEGR